jgi:D-alanyl-D-alanine carboxypeptidase (penicillin-binding protein 5/6)
MAMPASASDLQLHGQASLLLDGISGQVLYQHNAEVKHYPASTTKLLTALVAVEHGKLDQKIKVSANAVDQPPDSSSCYLQEGEEQPLEYLLYGLLLASGNDCAVAIAEGVSNGKTEQFIAWMNETAKRLGATESHFTNPHGLHDPNHYTTALDLALIARGALANPTVQRIAATREFFWPGKSEINGPYYNHNQMLWSYDGTIGGKTGFTEEARLTLVAAAKRGDQYLIGVVMGEESKTDQYADMTALLDMGFADFEQKQAVAAGAKFGEVPVTGGKLPKVTAVAARSFAVSTPKGTPPSVTVTPKLDANVVAPVKQGQQIGILEIREGPRVLETVPLVAEVPVATNLRANLMSRFQPSLRSAGTALLTGAKWLAYTFAGLLAFRTAVKLIRRRLRKARATHHRRMIRAARGRTGPVTYYRPRER